MFSLNARTPSAIPTGAPALWALFVVAALTVGCGRGDDPGREPAPRDSMVSRDGFVPMLDEERAADTILAADILPGAGDEYVVLSMRADSAAPARARADLLQAYRRDSAAGSFVLAFSDTVRWCVRRELRDLTGDGHPEIVLFTDAGGNDEVATRGLAVYSGADGAVRPLLRLSRGNPRFETDAAPDGTVLVFNELWPEFASHAQAVQYLDDVLTFRGGAFVSVRTERKSLFLEPVRALLEQYRKQRIEFRADTSKPADSAALPASQFGADSPAADSSDDDSVSLEGPHPLFMTSALVMFGYGRAGEVRSVRAFWASEADYLRRRLPAVQFDELRAIYERMLLR